LIYLHVVSAATVIVTLFVTVSSGHERHQHPGQLSGSLILSPAVVGSFIARGGTSGSVTLDVLVLWRGSPGWFMRGTRSAGRTTGDDRRYSVLRLQEGGLELAVAFDRQARTARIDRHDIVLGDANVVLVDKVDVPQGLEITGTACVAPQIEQPPEGIDIVFRNSPGLFAFLKCDAPLPEADAAVRQMVGATCKRIQAKPR
jgi:hypothetical protein